MVGGGGVEDALELFCAPGIGTGDVHTRRKDNPYPFVIGQVQMQGIELIPGHFLNQVDYPIGAEIPAAHIDHH
ncbi:hypothetical protein D3C73_1185570 [compost metagenome]